MTEQESIKINVTIEIPKNLIATIVEKALTKAIEKDFSEHRNDQKKEEFKTHLKATGLCSDENCEGCKLAKELEESLGGELSSNLLKNFLTQALAGQENQSQEQIDPEDLLDAVEEEENRATNKQIRNFFHRIYPKKHAKNPNEGDYKNLEEKFVSLAENLELTRHKDLFSVKNKKQFMDLIEDYQKAGIEGEKLTEMKDLIL